MPRAKQPVTINGDLEFDALISQTRTLEATAPQYAVEDGYHVSDAILLQPEKLDMVLYVTNTPVTWYSRHGGNQNRVDEVCKQMEELYFAREPVTITTTDATYTMMAIEKLEVSKSLEVGYARELNVSFVKIRVTYQQTTTIPDSYARSGVTEKKAGTANTETKTKTSSTKKATTETASTSSSSSSKSSSSSSGNSGGTATKGSVMTALVDFATGKKR